MKRLTPAANSVTVFHRADPEKLALFDPCTKECTMQCGLSSFDPRSKKEVMFLCDDCAVVRRPLPSPFALAKVAETLEIPQSDWSESAVIEQGQELVRRYKEMCSRLREVVEQYGLGLGGEHVDELVIAEIHRLKCHEKGAAQ
jgi:hypothetical protein